MLRVTTNRAYIPGLAACLLFVGIGGASADEREDAIELLYRARDEAVAMRVDDANALDRADVLVDIAGKLAAAGKVDEANGIVDVLRRDSISDNLVLSCFEAIDVAQARRDNFEGAFETIARPEAGYAMRARRELAKLLARRGRIDDAIRMCEAMIKSNPRRASGILTEVADTARQLGNRSGARAALDRAHEIIREHPLAESDELTALQELAVAYAHDGDDETARSLFGLVNKRAKEMQKGDDDAEFIAMSLADAGFFDDAFKTAERVDPRETDFLTNGPRIEWVYGEIGLAAAKSGHPIQAQRAVDLLTRDGIKARVVAAVSQANWKAGQTREADEAYHSAMELMLAAKTAASVPEIILACGELIRANLARKAIDEAIAVTDHMPPTGAR